MKYKKYTWNQFDRDAKIIASLLRKSGRKFDGVYGPARGGLPLAVVISHALNIPFYNKPKTKNTLIVDDIADSGKTLKRYSKTHFIVTLFYHSQSKFIPTIWLHKKGTEWILFPWESNKTSK
ncbi:MAG: phosphoribosyltransferase [Patescibacteria group bacterium]